MLGNVWEQHKLRDSCQVSKKAALASSICINQNDRTTRFNLSNQNTLILLRYDLALCYVILLNITVNKLNVYRLKADTLQ